MKWIIKILLILFIVNSNIQANQMTEELKFINLVAKVGDSTLKGLVNDEAKKLGYNVGGKIIYAIVSTLNIRVNWQILNKIETKALYIAYSQKPLAKANKLDWIFLLTDIIETATKEVLYPKNEPMQLVIDTFYGNAKAAIQFSTATNAFDKTGAALTWAETNGKAIIQSAASSYKLYQEQIKLNIAKGNIENYSKIIKLKYKYEKKYCQESDGSKKANILVDFMSKCSLISTNNKNFYIHYCKKLSNNIVAFDKIKYYNLFYTMKDNPAFFNDNTWVNNYIESFFPHDEHQYLKKLYKVINLDIKIGYPKNSATYEHVRRLYAYGIKKVYLFIFSYKKITITKAATYVSLILKRRYGINKTKQEIISNSGFTNTTKLTRKVYGKILVDNFKLSKIKPTHNQLATYLQLKKIGRPTSEARLAMYKIIPGFKNEKLYKALSNKIVTYYRLVQMLSDTLDIVTCGHKGCSYKKILKGEK